MKISIDEIILSIDKMKKSIDKKKISVDKRKISTDKRKISTDEIILSTEERSFSNVKSFPSMERHFICRKFDFFQGRSICFLIHRQFFAILRNCFACHKLCLNNPLIEDF